MAKLMYEALMSENGTTIPTDAEVEIIEAVDDGMNKFKVKWKTPKTEITGTIATASLKFTPEEIETHRIPTDAKESALYRNAEVQYIGESNDALAKGDRLFDKEL